jgi:hypothetical protein
MEIDNSFSAIKQGDTPHLHAVSNGLREVSPISYLQSIPKRLETGDNARASYDTLVNIRIS